jgi:hypothetical protein
MALFNCFSVPQRSCLLTSTAFAAQVLAHRLNKNVSGRR